MKKALVLIKSGFTLLEMAIVLLVIGILMAATMNFGSNRIVDLKAQSAKEQFVGRYNDLYSQNMTSSFRDGQKYQQLTMTFQSGVRYHVDDGSSVVDPKLSSITFRELMIDGESVDSADLRFAPYVLGCAFS